ncbi:MULTISPECIES: histidinol-phosphate transaminase [Nostoc]|uniref:Histidinol-phosphate aminotransferase n=1 Tax=Nostoc paludosum FACHB-159 TaxID=2692908 RepID=A0ABR8KBG2_9NOSO|nr:MULTISPECIES: histidinol-phosphate transaminase [Nostoc]MBD2679875.1 histidinol-phosphate transaminase [Nostoc sp. FACHB-857]MBD2736126.1 histidinol-phosphate transaminase [Nostoc paludosum FACHB-159]
MLPFIRADLAQFTAYKPHPSSDTAASVPTQFDRLDTNESPYDLPSQLKEKLAWTYKQEIETNRYPDGGHETLKSAIAKYVNESAGLLPSLFNAANISVGNGSDELIRSLLIATCLGGEGSILVANPTFSMYGILAQTLGIPVVAVGRNEINFEIDLKAAQSAIEETQNPPIRVVFVVHPNSPTANSLTTAELLWLKSLPEHILVVIDEAYFEFSQTTLVGELPQHPNWVILRTFSKAFRLASLRVGYCVAHPEAIAILEKIRLPYNLPSFSIAAALIALQNRPLLLESIGQILSERAKLIEALSQQPELQITTSTANFIYVRLKPNSSHSQDASLKSLHHKLRTVGTLVRYISGGLRITVGTTEENARTINRVQAALANLQS